MNTNGRTKIDLTGYPQECQSHMKVERKNYLQIYVKILPFFGLFNLPLVGSEFLLCIYKIIILKYFV
jgi:hypothetical protein